MQPKCIAHEHIMDNDSIQKSKKKTHSKHNGGHVLLLITRLCNYLIYIFHCT